MKRTKLLAKVEYFKFLLMSNEKKVNGSLQKKNVKKKAWNLRCKFHGRDFMKKIGCLDLILALLVTICEVNFHSVNKTTWRYFKD